MIGRITLGMIVGGGIMLVAVTISLQYLPTYYHAASLYSLNIPTPSSVTAKAWAVFSLEDGEILYAQNEHEVLPMASVSKLVTAWAVMSEGNIFATTTVSWGAVSTDGRAGRLVPGETLSRHQLLFPLLLESSNDAAVVLEESYVDHTLVKDMNELASSTGATHTHFIDPSGLSVGNVSTAADLADMYVTLSSSFPHITDITHLQQYLISEHEWQNVNPFVHDAGYVGGKHGFTPEAGRTAVVVFSETFPRGKTAQVGYVVLGSTDLVHDVRALRELVRVGVGHR